MPSMVKFAVSDNHITIGNLMNKTWLEAITYLLHRILASDSSWHHRALPCGVRRSFSTWILERL